MAVAEASGSNTAYTPAASSRTVWWRAVFNRCNCMATSKAHATASMRPAWWQWRARVRSERLRGLVYSRFSMRAKIIVTLAALVASAFAAEIPRKSPEFMVQLIDGKQAQVSDYGGKVF